MMAAKAGVETESGRVHRAGKVVAAAGVAPAAAVAAAVVVGMTLRRLVTRKKEAWVPAKWT